MQAFVLDLVVIVRSGRRERRGEESPSSRISACLTVRRAGRVSVRRRLRWLVSKGLQTKSSSGRRRVVRAESDDLGATRAYVVDLVVEVALHLGGSAVIVEVALLKLYINRSGP